VRRKTQKKIKIMTNSNSKIYGQSSSCYLRLALKNEKCSTGATGRAHSLVVSMDGKLFSFGANKCGQLGIGKVTDMQTTPSLVKGIKGRILRVSAGAEFSVALNESLRVYSWGSPEYSQLGHNTDMQYFLTSTKLVFEPQPDPLEIEGLVGKDIVDIKSGANHTLALDDKGEVYVWGFGGYGRLGLGDQKDLWVPTWIPAVETRKGGVKAIACGGAFSAAVGPSGQLFMWGKVKSSGDAWTRPTHVPDLMGWNVKVVSCGSTTTFVFAENCVISFGSALYGELGFGEETKSSARPKKVDSLQNTSILDISCGVGHTLLLCKKGDAALASLPIFQAKEEEETNDGDEICEICQSGEDADNMLLCDGCDKGYHMKCLTPPLQTLPEGDWFCSECEKTKNTKGKRKATILKGKGKEPKEKKQKRATKTSEEEIPKDNEKETEKENEKEIEKEKENEKKKEEPSKKKRGRPKKS